MKNFIVIFLLTFLRDGVFGADETKKEVTEGDSLTLPTALTETQSSDQILWLYGSDKTIIASIGRGSYNTDDDDDDERFKGNLELDKQTGSLTIKNIRIINAGLYQLDINRKPSGKFTITVYARLPTPEIDSPQCAQTPAGSSSLKCVFQCSVQTSDPATLSWYKGNSLVSRKISNICSRISLPLEVNYDDKNPYSCVVNNPISNKTQHLDITHLCHTCPDPGWSSGAVAGMVIAAVVTVAVIAGLIYYVKPKLQNRMLKTVMEGESLTLSPKTKINKDDQILWVFKNEKSCIDEIKKGTEIKYDDEELDKNTGSLIIKKTTTDHSGLYKLKIRRGIKTLYEEIYVSVSERPISVTEGESVNLKPDAEINKDDQILLWFGNENLLTAIAENKSKTQEMLTYEYAADGRFRDRLKLDENTGSLTIMNTRTDHTGLYKLQIRDRSGGVSENTYSVIVRDKVEEKLLEGKESVTLNPDTEIQEDDLILWMFGDDDTLLAQIKGQNGEIIKYDDVNGRFGDILELDKKTGSLTITKLTANHIGLYKLLIINSRGTSYKKFKILKKVIYESVMEGESVTLKTDAEIQIDDQIEWRFGDKDLLLAEVKGETGETSIYDHVPDGRFRHKLHLDKKAKSLTINKITTKHAGVYNLKITNSRKGNTWSFIVIVKAKTKSMERLNEKQANESATVGMPLLN